MPPLSQGSRALEQAEGDEPELIPGPLHSSEQSHFQIKTPLLCTGQSCCRALWGDVPRSPLCLACQDPRTLQAHRRERQQFSFMTF